MKANTRDAKTSNSIDKTVRHWHALYVKSRAEKKVLSQLEEMGIKAYLPLITRVKQWSDRRKKVEEPLFKSYVFVFSNEKEHIPILNVYGVVKFVSFERKAVIVPENEIIAIKRYIDNPDENEDERDHMVLEKGQTVRVTNGPMQGLKGTLISVKNKNHLLVYIESVGQHLLVSIPRTKVEPIEGEKAISYTENN